MGWIVQDHQMRALVIGLALTVWTRTCDASTPCPRDATGTVGTCNNRGICKPAAANACHP